MRNEKQKFLYTLAYEHMFFLIFGFVALYSYWAWGNRISMGIARPDFFHFFFLACAGVWGFLLIGRIGDLANQYSILPDFGKRGLRELAAPLAIVLSSLWLYRDFLQGEFPSTYDHTTQILRCHLTEEALWNHGTLLPWTSAVGAGVPLNDLFPPGGAMLFCLIRLLSGFLLNREAAYIATVFTSWFVLAGGLYAAGRLFFGIAGGALAAGLLIVTAGSQLQGGWIQVFSVGMWPSALCCGLAIVALAIHAHALVHDCGWRSMALFSLSIAGAIVAHPFSLPALAASIPLFMILSLVSAEDKSLALRRCGRNVFFSLLGFGLAAWWVLPFFASSAWRLPFGAPNPSPEAISIKAIDGRFFSNLPPTLVGVVWLGIFWGLVSRRIETTALSVAGVFFLLLDQTAWKFWFYSPWWDSITMNIPLARLAGFSKYFGFILIGGMAQPVLTNLPALAASGWKKLYVGFDDFDSSSPILILLKILGRNLAAAIVLAALLPTAIPAATYFYTTYTQSKGFELKRYPEYPPYAKDFEAAMRYLQTIDPPRRDNDFFSPISTPRIGVHTSLVESCIPYRFGYGIVPPYYTPTMLLTTRSVRSDDAAPYLSGMKYILAIGKIVNLFQKEPGVAFLDRFGEITILKQQQYSETPIQLLRSPDGCATIETNKPNHLSIRLEGLTDTTWTRVGVSRYRKWRAFQNGKELPILEHIEPGEPLDAGRYISVAAQNGLLELQYAPQPIDWLAYGLSAFCFLALAAIGKSRQLFHAVSWETPLFAQWIRFIQSKRFQTGVYILIGCLFAAAALGFRLQKTSQQTRFWYSGVLNDRLSPLKPDLDGKLDLGFGLEIGKEHKGKVLTKATLREIYPKPLVSHNKWTTDNEPGWKLILSPLDEKHLEIWRKFGEPLFIPLNPIHRVDLYAANPHQGAYIPTGTEMELTLHFAGGETAAYRCPIGPQGTH